MTNNPYEDDTSPDLPDGSFVARECMALLLERAKKLNAKPGYVFGLPDTGKTALAYQIMHRLEALPGREVLYLDLNEIPRNKGASSRFIGELNRFILDKIRVYDAELADRLELDYENEVRYFEHLLQTVKEKQLPVTFTVLVDSFCHQLHSEHRDVFYDKVVTLAGVLGKRKCAKVFHFIFFARRSVLMVQSHSGASYLYNKCDSYALHPFSEAETRELCARSLLAVDPAHLHMQTGGNPRLMVMVLDAMHNNGGSLQEVCRSAEIRAQMQLSMQMFSKLFREFLDPNDAMADSLREQGVETCLECLIWRELYDVQIPSDINAEFEGYGLGAQQLPKHMGGLKAYLSADQKVGTQLLRLVKLEQDFRRLIDSRLSKLYGTDDWWRCVKISAEENWDCRKRDIIKTLRKWQTDAYEQYADSSQKLLDYAYPDDLWGLIEKVRLHWDGREGWVGFKHDFHSDDGRFSEGMRAFADIRNPEHHCRLPPQRLQDKFDRHYHFLRDNLNRALNAR